MMPSSIDDRIIYRWWHHLHSNHFPACLCTKVPHIEDAILTLMMPSSPDDDIIYRWWHHLHSNHLLRWCHRLWMMASSIADAIIYWWWHHLQDMIARYFLLTHIEDAIINLMMPSSIDDAIIYRWWHHLHSNLLLIGSCRWWHDLGSSSDDGIVYLRCHHLLMIASSTWPHHITNDSIIY